MNILSTHSVSAAGSFTHRWVCFMTWQSKPSFIKRDFQSYNIMIPGPSFFLFSWRKELIILIIEEMIWVRLWSKLHDFLLPASCYRMDNLEMGGKEGQHKRGEGNQRKGVGKRKEVRGNKSKGRGIQIKETRSMVKARGEGKCITVYIYQKRGTGELRE